MTDTNDKTENVENAQAAAAEPADTEGGAQKNLALRTNTRMRQKYYVNEKDVISSMQAQSHVSQHRFSKVIRQNTVVPKSKPVVIHSNRVLPPGEIKVDVIREGADVKGIRIHCPCGRHTEVNFEYKTPTDAATPKT